MNKFYSKDPVFYKKVFAIKENETVLNVTPDTFTGNCVILDTYKNIEDMLNG